MTLLKNGRTQNRFGFCSKTRWRGRGTEGLLGRRVEWSRCCQPPSPLNAKTVYDNNNSMFGMGKDNYSHFRSDKFVERIFNPTINYIEAGNWYKDIMAQNGLSTYESIKELFKDLNDCKALFLFSKSGYH